MWLEERTTQGMLAVVTLLLTYLLVEWLKNPLRKIPGPPGLPLLGNTLSFNLANLHNQFYEMARKYGAVMTVKIFTKPIVIINSREACLEALTKTGTDSQGRPPFFRQKKVTPKSIITMNFSDEQVMLRRHFTKALKAYGPGIAHLENVMQETILDIIDTLDQKSGQPVSAKELNVGYACCVIASIMFGEKYSFDDEVCQKIEKMSDSVVQAGDPMTRGAAIDALPFLFHFKFLFKEACNKIEVARKVADDFVWPKIAQAKKSFDPNDKRGCLDYFIEVQQQEVDEDGKPLLDDEAMKGLLLVFIIGGLETSQRSLTQLFLDILHNPTLQKELQEELDSKFEPTQRITLKDQEKLPLMESFLLEHFRYFTQVPFLVPHMTIRDTTVAGFKIPANTTVLINSYYAAHNPDVYDEPFKVNPKRFLDEYGQVVDREHPLRQNLIGFGMGRRSCPGEFLAKSRIFLFLANILQKYNIELVGELPDSDVRKYRMSVMITPPDFNIKLTRRQ